MKLIDLSLPDADREFGSRLVTLNSGRSGIRAGIHTTCKEVDGSAPVMDFIASDETVDRYEEVIKQDGWELDNFMANPVIPDCHNYGTIANILGRDILTKDQQVQNGHLCTRIEFATDNPMGLLAWKMSKGGFIKSMSVGFIPLEWVNGNAAGQPARTYVKAELLEKSLVVVPANPGATIGNQIKSVLNVSERRDLAEFLKQICGEEKPDPAGKGSAAAAEVHAAHELQIWGELIRILKK
jgi:HK97 family phage prohead protease